MAEYRWNRAEFANGYDHAAPHIHPYYTEIQQQILESLDGDRGDFLLVDAGGGSGRLVELFLERCSGGRAILLDQSESFVELARNKLQPFGDRVAFHVVQLQADWSEQVGRPDAIVSMSAIHHLDENEKRRFYQACYSALAAGGILLNGDEIRSPDDAEYLQHCRDWAAYMHNVMDRGLIPEPMCAALLGWEERNVTRFGDPRKSGDDCHETVAAQCEYLTTAGFSSVEVPWQKEMWAIFKAVKES